MKDPFITLSLLLSIIIIVVGFNVASATASLSLSKPFGGEILNTEATEIQSVENSNYKCEVPGTTITIKSATRSAPTTYLIPSSVDSKTNTYPRRGMKIKGTYGQTKTTITCTYQGYPPSQTTVELTPITLYGTSKR